MVSWSGQSCGTEPFDESILVLVAEWVPSKDTVELYELSSTLCVVLQEWLGNEIMESLGDQTWIDLSEECTNLCTVHQGTGVFFFGDTD